MTPPIRNLAHPRTATLVALALLLLCPFARAQNATSAAIRDAYFRIKIVDDQTSRGIPLVRLSFTDKNVYYTDSAGVIAYLEPELMNCDVEATIESYGYSYAKDMFNNQTFRFVPKPGGSIVIAMHRHNIAERLYRTTGVGIYRDSVLLGDTVPATSDPSTCPVTGIDGSEVAQYKGKLMWIRGDTGVSATGLGNFRSTGAISELPGKGGLDPEVGVTLNYFRNDTGRVRPMVNIESKGPVWFGGLRVALDKSGQEHLFGDYLKVRTDKEKEEKGLVEFNDKTRVFDRVTIYSPESPVEPLGRPFRYKEDGVEYFGMFDEYAPAIRCRADIESVKNPASYEGFTCLKDGSRFNGKADQLDRDSKGRLRWEWKKNTSPIGKNLSKMLASGIIKPEEAWFRLTDVRTGKVLGSHGGSVYWNPYRKRWVSVQLQEFGDSWLGEVWYYEGDTPLGPWVYGQKIITHALRDETKEEGKRMDELVGKKDDVETQSFYCVKHHPLFDKEGGRIIFVEGTLSSSFASAKTPTPRYDYNQMMYKVDLSDPRLFLPVPIYRVEGKTPGYYSKEAIPAKAKVGDIAFYAPDRPRKGTSPFYLRTGDGKADAILTADKPEENSVPAFFALSEKDYAATSTTLTSVVPLNEFTNTKTGSRTYATGEPAPKGFEKPPKPVCYVWPNPIFFNPLPAARNRIEGVVEH